MKSKATLTPNANGQVFLILLFGSLEYDGRVKRMIEVLQEIGQIMLIDLKADRKDTESWFEGLDRISLQLLKSTNKFKQHLRFWLTSVCQSWRIKPKIVIAEDYFTCFPGLLAAKLSCAKLAYDAHELIIPEAGRKMGPRSRFWYLLERWAVGQADLVIAANVDRAKLMAGHYELKQIPEGMRNIPPRRCQPASPEEVLQAYPALARRNHEDRIILYQGNVSLSRGLERFVEALEFLPACYRIIVAGSGPDLDKLCTMAERFIKEARFDALGKIENQMLPAITPLADVGIVCYPFQGLNNIHCAPNKLFEYAQAGLPVVATNQPPLMKALETFKIGELVCEKNSPEQIAFILQEVMSNKKRYRQQLESFLEANQWKYEAERVRNAFENI